MVKIVSLILKIPSSEKPRVDIYQIKKSSQYAFSISIILGISLLSFMLRHLIDYRIVALLLFLAVSVFAVLLDVIPVVLSAILSALILNVFFIDPIYHYKIDNSENALLFIMYLLIALVSSILIHRIRKERKKFIQKEQKENTLKLYETILNSLSHELRIPITTIIGSIDTLRENKVNLSLGQQEELFSEIQSAGFRLNDQVENLLNMSRLESGAVQLNKDWVDISELIYLCISNLNVEKTHTIYFSPDENLPLFKVDFGLMEQIIHGILQNALKYTPPKSSIQIEVKEKDGFLDVTISDDGEGFPEESLQHIFDKFYRLENSGIGGTGLGLSIVKGFVEAQNGKISLTNKKEGGACFKIQIPAETSYLKNLKNE